MQTIVGSSLQKMEDLITPSATQQYPLGTQIVVEDDTKHTRAVYMYVKSHTGLTQYQPYVVGYGSTHQAEIVSAAPATLTTVGSQTIIPQVAVTSGYYFFGLIEGDGKGLMTAETYALGDYLEILNAGTAFVVDGASSSTIYTIQSRAICKSAGTTAVAKDLYLINRSAACQAA